MRELTYNIGVYWFAPKQKCFINKLILQIKKKISFIKFIISRFSFDKQDFGLQYIKYYIGGDRHMYESPPVSSIFTPELFHIFEACGIVSSSLQDWLTCSNSKIALQAIHYVFSKNLLVEGSIHSIHRLQIWSDGLSILLSTCVRITRNTKRDILEKMLKVSF